MNERRSNPDFLNGVPELLVLALVARRPMYGYQIVQAIKARSAEALAFGEGCIYPILHKLERESLLTSRREVVGGRSRIVYRLSAKGKGRLAASASAWERVAGAIRAVLDERGDSRDARPAMA